jgi:hypothetical protein
MTSLSSLHHDGERLFVSASDDEVALVVDADFCVDVFINTVRQFVSDGTVGGIESEDVVE